MAVIPKCTVCGASGRGVEFPMLPANEFRKFGSICDECDCREMKLLERWRGGPIPASVRLGCEERHE